MDKKCNKCSRGFAVSAAILPGTVILLSGRGGPFTSGVVKRWLSDSS